MAFVRIFDREFFRLHFDNGALHLKNDEYHLIYTAWPNIRVICKPDIQALGLSHLPSFNDLLAKWASDPNYIPPDNFTLAEVEAIEAWALLIPKHIRDYLNQFQNAQWNLLESMGNIEYFEDFAFSHPFLAHITARYRRYYLINSYDHLDSISEIISLKRTVQVERLGFRNANKSLVKVLQKISPSALDEDTCQLMVSIYTLNPDVILQLRHYRGLINKEQLYLISDLQERIAFTENLSVFLESYSAEQYARSTIVNCMDDTISLSIELQEHCPKFRTIEHLMKWHDKLVKKFEATVNLADLPDYYLTLFSFLNTINRYYPEPPFPGNCSIHPITNTEELSVVAERLENCIRSYQTDILREKRFVYEIRDLKNKGRTVGAICLEKSDQQWQLKEYSGIRNTRLDKGSESIIVDWWSKVLLGENGSCRQVNSDG